MSGNHFLYIRPWHFLLAIVIFCVLTGIIAGKDARDIPSMEKGNSFLTELQDIDLGGSGITCVFFYREDSELCRRMRYNIEPVFPYTHNEATVSGGSTSISLNSCLCF